MATVKDIAKLAGVSPTTVSWALNGKHVSQDALEKVLLAASELNYHRRMSARSLRSGKVFSVGFYIVNPTLEARLNTAYVFPMLAGISKVLSEKDYSMQFEVITPATTDVLVKKALQYSVDGMIVLPQYSDVTATVLANLAQTDCPIIFLERDAATQFPYVVSVDHFYGTAMAIRYLYSKGHRDIAVITGPENHVDSIIRVDACASIMADLGLSTRPEWFQRGQFGIQDGYQCMTEILHSGQLPTAVFCLNDYMAVGAMRAILDKGLRIPHDISVIGFDDGDIAEACYPPLTTIRQPLFEQGSIAAKLLLDLIQEQPIEDSTVLIHPVLVERESVADRSGSLGQSG